MRPAYLAPLFPGELRDLIQQHRMNNAAIRLAPDPWKVV
jgi:hypothetical protein